MITQDGTKIQRPSTLQAIGIELGVECAKNILLHANDSTKREAILSILHYAMENFITDQQKNNGLTPAGEAEYRLGCSRGLVSQILHPKARIEIKTKVPAVV